MLFHSFKIGYTTAQVTILTMYSGQLFEVKRLMKQYEILQGVRATVVDNFQGEESDIIILTFVRSNVEGNIGFLSVSNRVNVALSRAKKGLYCIGNFGCLLEKSKLWQNIIQKLRNQGAIGPALELYCQNHPDTPAFVAKGEDFQKSPEGGCMLPCNARLVCGHVCQSTCHVLDAEHELVKCSKNCDKIACERQHRCKKKCHHGTNCPPCNVRIPKIKPSCGHEVQVSCSASPENTFCNSNCDKTRSCGHKCKLRCGNNCESSSCTAEVRVYGACGHTVQARCCDVNDVPMVMQSCQEPCGSILECGHLCPGKCGSCHQKRLHVACIAKCARPLVCGHLCKDNCATNCPPCREKCQNECPHSKCTKICGVPCAPCREPCRWTCAHKQCDKLCHEQCNRELCLEPCTNQLKCDHPCIGVCGEPCPTLCRICNEEEVTAVFFGDEDEPDARFVQLRDCKHIIEVNGLMNWLKISAEGNSTVIQMKTCQVCKTVIRKTKSLNSFIQICLRDLESVKQKTYGTIEENIKKQEELFEAINNNAALAGLGASKYVIDVAEAYQNLRQGVEPIKGRKHISLPRMTLNNIENVYEVWKTIVGGLSNLTVARAGTHKNIGIPVVDELELRASQLLKFMKKFNNNTQQVLDVSREIRLLELTSQSAREINQRVFLDKGKNILRNAFKMVVLPGPFSEMLEKKFKEMVVEANSHASGLGISLEEKNMVLKAINLGKGKHFEFATFMLRFS